MITNILNDDNDKYEHLGYYKVCTIKTNDKTLYEIAQYCNNEGFFMCGNPQPFPSDYFEEEPTPLFTCGGCF
jgi:hypothetical protein